MLRCEPTRRRISISRRSRRVRPRLLDRLDHHRRPNRAVGRDTATAEVARQARRPTRSTVQRRRRRGVGRRRRRVVRRLRRRRATSPPPNKEKRADAGSDKRPAAARAVDGDGVGSAVESNLLSSRRARVPSSACRSIEGGAWSTSDVESAIDSGTRELRRSIRRHLLRRAPSPRASRRRIAHHAEGRHLPRGPHRRPARLHGKRMAACSSDHPSGVDVVEEGGIEWPTSRAHGPVWQVAGAPDVRQPARVVLVRPPGARVEGALPGHWRRCTSAPGESVNSIAWCPSESGCSSRA